jgi:hypothetical protein
MRTYSCGHGLSLLRKGRNLLFSFDDSCSYGWGLALASMLTVVWMSTGCDPKPPPAEDLGTIISSPAFVAGSEDPYEYPENVARRIEEVERKKADSDEL